VLLSAVYADTSVPRLERKWRKWAEFAGRHLIDRAHEGSGRIGFSPT